ncbi:MAG: hypothetical protein ACHQ1D_07610, partial [Nitrososphaerales archaeon]
SGHKKHYETTLERVRDYYGLVMDIDRFKKAINNLDKIRKAEVDLSNIPEGNLFGFLDEFDLLDPRTFALTG